MTTIYLKRGIKSHKSSQNVENALFSGKGWGAQELKQGLVSWLLKESRKFDGGILCRRKGRGKLGRCRQRPRIPHSAVGPFLFSQQSHCSCLRRGRGLRAVLQTVKGGSSGQRYQHAWAPARLCGPDTQWGWTEEPEGCAKVPDSVPEVPGGGFWGFRWGKLESWPSPAPVAALALGTTLQVLCLLLHFRELRVDLECSSPTEQEKEEDRFHSLQRFRADLAAQGKPG